MMAVSVNDDSRVLRRRRENPYVQNVAVAYNVVKSVVLRAPPNERGKERGQLCVKMHVCMRLLNDGGREGVRRTPSAEQQRTTISLVYRGDKTNNVLVRVCP